MFMFPKLDPDDPRIDERLKDIKKTDPLAPFKIVKIAIELAKEDNPSLEYLCAHYPMIMGTLIFLGVTPFLGWMYLLFVYDSIVNVFRK